MPIVVIHGPQRTGKSLHADAFRNFYGCSRSIDWTAHRRSCSPSQDGDLLLTIEAPEVVLLHLPNATLVPIEAARAAIGLEPVPEGGFPLPGSPLAQGVASIDDGRTWLWWAGEGETPDTYFIESPTRDGVIAAARREYGDDATIAIVEATQDGPFDADIFDHEAVHELIGERFVEVNSDRWGKDGWEGFQCDEAADTLLAQLLRDAFALWLDEHGRKIPTWTFTGQRNKEIIPPPHGGLV